MGIVYLLRHAKAVGAQPGMADRDRPLAEQGWREARAMGAVLHRRGHRPARVVCSPSRRTRETLEAVSEALQSGATAFAEGLFSGGSEDYLAAIRGAGEADSIMLIGHNPMIESTAVLLSGHREREAGERLAAGFPTSGVAVIRFAGPLAAVEPRTGHLEEFLTPASA